MIRALKAFVDWLDRRFPAKVVFTEGIFLAINKESEVSKKLFEDVFSHFKMQEARIAASEKSIAAIKDYLAKSGTISADKRRADFIAEGRITQ